MIEVYGKAGCVYCTSAKNLLTNLEREFKYYSVPEDLSLEAFFEKFPGRKKFPQIVYHGRLLDDGYSSLREEIENESGGHGDDFR